MPSPPFHTDQRPLSWNKYEPLAPVSVDQKSIQALTAAPQYDDFRISLRDRTCLEGDVVDEAVPLMEQLRKEGDHQS